MTNNINLKEEIQVYTLNEISRDFGFNIQTLRRYITEGKLRAKKVGKQYYCRKKDIVDFFLPK
jgi:predicted site-specific integrase-resolvase